MVGGPAVPDPVSGQEQVADRGLGRGAHLVNAGDGGVGGVRLLDHCGFHHPCARRLWERRPDFPLRNLQDLAAGKRQPDSGGADHQPHIGAPVFPGEIPRLVEHPLHLAVQRTISSPASSFSDPARRSARRRLFTKIPVERWERISSRMSGWMAGQMLLRRSPMEASPLGISCACPSFAMSSTGISTFRSNSLEAPASTMATGRGFRAGAAGGTSGRRSFTGSL
jgi:hypothetical protein